MPNDYQSEEAKATPIMIDLAHSDTYNLATKWALVI